MSDRDLLPAAEEWIGLHPVFERGEGDAGLSSEGLVVLQPDESDGWAIFKVQFPRVTRADFPVGRGILFSSGRISRVQVAIGTGPEVDRRSDLVPGTASEEQTDHRRS